MNMNRVIKFRAWGIDRCRMHDVYNIAFHESYGYKAITSEQPLDLHSTFTKKEEFILMQYTGLKDNNEKEIYEGDILSFTTEDYYDGFYVEKNYVEAVEFDEGSYWAGGQWLTEIIANDCEATVLGNIYENPELLEVES